MKYLKSFQESNLFRNIDIEIKHSEYTKLFGGKPCFIYDNVFYIGDYKISAFFQEMHSPIKHWEGAHGYYEKDGSELIDRELNLSYTNTLNLIQVISNLSIDFLKNKQPDILVFNHRDMDNETDTELFKNKINKRAKIIYSSIKDKIPSGYILSYWYNDYYQDENDSASTSCIIYKQNADISALIKDRVKIEI